MQSLYEELVALLKADKLLYAEGTLLKNKVVELALANDSNLLAKLLTNSRIKERFFVQAGKVWVFDQEAFVRLVNNFSFLPGSYTAFKQAIGLQLNGRYLTEVNDVSLVWPFKDCVLEGGMEKEDEKRDEVFFSETMAHDDIDRLLEPKVLINFTRIDKLGDHNVEDFNRLEDGHICDNLVIKGNNLLSLRSLKREFTGQVKMVYIDPPYNSETEKFYNDTFRHSTWLTFMKNRLEVVRDFLRPDGVVFISIDDTEQAYLKILCDEVFKRDNFLAQIAYERSGVSGLGQGGAFLVNTHETILCFAKSKQSFKPVDLTGEGPFEKKDMQRYNKILISPGKRKQVASFEAPSTKEKVIIYKHEGFKVETISLRDYKNRKGEILATYVSEFDKVFRNTSIQEENEFQNRIMSYCQDGYFSADYTVSRGKKAGQKVTNYYFNGGIFVWLKDSAKVEDSAIIKTNKLSDFWTHASIPKADLSNEGGVKLRRGKKPENLLKRLLRLTTEDDDLVLDFFLGSGTTAAVCHKMNRRYIGLEQIDYEDNDGVTRLKNVIDGDSTGVSKEVNWNGGGSFIHCELAKWNEVWIDRVKKAKSSAALTKLWNQLKKEAFLNYRVDPQKIDGAAKEFSELSTYDKKSFLVEVLDKNHLYVNLSDIDDVDYGITEADKNLNKKFYGLE